MGRFKAIQLPLEGAYLLETAPILDQRGSFTRLFCRNDLAEVGWLKPPAQINLSETRIRGTVRGMHYQNYPHAEMKLVQCMHGKVWDVILDIRPDSSTFLQWHAEILSETNRNAMLIPEGFAHGFQSLTNGAQLLYMHSEFFHPESAVVLNVRDKQFDIDWPIDITNISEVDLSARYINTSFKGVYQ